MARSVALSFAVLLAVFEIGSCLRCFQCNSQTDRDCADPFQGSRNLVDCSTQDSINYNRAYLSQVLPSHISDGVLGAPRNCVKIVLSTNTVVRTCLDVNPLQPEQTCRGVERAAYETQDPTKQIKQCTVCQSDACNGAGSLSASLPIAALALVASYLYYKQ